MPRPAGVTKCETDVFLAWYGHQKGLRELRDGEREKTCEIRGIKMQALRRALVLMACRANFHDSIWAASPAQQGRGTGEIIGLSTGP